MSCISCSVPLWCSSICFMAQASTHLCFHGEIKVVGAPVPAVQSLSTLVSLHLHHVLILPFISPLSCHSCLSFPLFFFFLIIFYSHLWLSLPLSLSLISSCPLSLSLSHPFCSAVKASSRVFQKIKTLSPSLCIYRSVPPALSITLQMLHWMFPSPRSNRSDSKPVFSLLSTAACESAWHRFFFSFILLFVFLCMRIREPCWRDYSLLWELWRSPNVIICSTSSCVFGAVFHIQLCRWGSSVKYCVLFSKVCSARCVDGVKVRTTCSHVRGVRCLIKRMLQEMRCMVDFAVMMMQPLWLKQQLMKGNLVVILSPVRCKTAQDIMSICGKRRLVPALMVVRL